MERWAMLIELPLAACSEWAVNSSVARAEYFPDFASEPLTQIVVGISLSKRKPNALTRSQPSPIAKFSNIGLGLAPVVFSPVEVTVKFRQKKAEVTSLVNELRHHVFLVQKTMLLAYSPPQPLQAAFGRRLSPNTVVLFGLCLIHGASV
jgi:hypothetical protein